MMHKILTLIDRKILNFKEIKAHCDVPCGVYDPISAQVAAMTVARMTDTITELEAHDQKDHAGARDMDYHNKITRMIDEKERSAELVKHEVRIIWGDYFKAPQFEAHPGLHNLTHEIMMIASKCKQNVDTNATRLLMKKVNEFSEIFFSSKSIKTKTVKYHCKPNLDIITPDL